MYLLPAAPTTVTGVLSNAWRLYLAVLPRCLPPVALAVLALGALGSMVVPPQLATLGLDDLVLVRDYLMAPRVWMAGAGIGAITLLINTVVFRIADAVARGRPAPFMAALGGALGRWWPTLAVAVVFVILVGIGTLFFLLPGLYLWGVYQFAFVAVANGEGVEEALRTSRRLVRGHWFRSSTAVSLGLTFVTLLTLAAQGAVGTVTLLAGAEVHGVVLAQQLLLGVLDLFLLPYVPVLMLCTFHDLKLRQG